MIDVVKLGNRLREHRANCGLSMLQASQAALVSESTLFRLEHGLTKCVYMTTVDALCDLYQTTLSDITKGL